MTEAEWLACNEPGRMFEYLNEQDASRRKFRLFSCACCRHIWHLMTHENSREAVEIAERIAEGLATLEEGEAIADALEASARERVQQWDTEQSAAFAAVFAASSDIRQNHGNAEFAIYVLIHVFRAIAIASGASLEDHPLGIGVPEARQIICHLLRDIFGNPFRASNPPPSAVLAWNDGRVRRIAEGIYEGRRLPEGTLDGARLAVLSDALVDAGSDNEELIAHLRSPGPHVRGCWALDLILEKM